MDKSAIIEILLAIALLGFVWGAIGHKKLVASGGLPGFLIKPENQLTKAGRKAKKLMLTGYGAFLASIALMLAVSIIWGPVKR